MESPIDPAARPSSAMPPGRELAAARDLLARLDALATHHAVPFAGGGTMAWRRYGEGPPLVLIHGGHGSWMHWVRNIEALSDSHTLWIPDLPGYGDSDLVDSTGVGPIVDAVVQSLQALVGGAAVDLCGFSFGGLIASLVAAARGGVGRVALIGTAGHGLATRYRLEMRNWRLATAPEALWGALRNNLAALMLHDPAAIDALALEVHRACCTATRFRSRKISRTQLLRPILEGVAAPVLLLWGEHDLTTHPEEAIESLKAPGGKREGRILDGAGHWAQFEASAAVNRALLDWFDPTRT